MAIPTQMHGVILTGHGDYDRLQWREDLPVPKPRCGEVLIRVAAAAVNNTDLNTRKAWYSKRDGAAADASWSGSPIVFPRIQGIDACGVIVAVGEGVDSGRLGERVLVEPCLWEMGGETLDQPGFLGSECDGGFAQYLAVAARHAFRIDSDLSDLELASFPCSYSTAENMLLRAQAGADDVVLITGASGGVGSAAVQLACARGAGVIAVCGAGKAESLRQLGADQVLDRTANVPDALAAAQVDVVIDLVGGPHWPHWLDALKRGGRYAVSGAIAGAQVTLDLRMLYLRDLRFFGCTVLEPEVFPALLKRIEAGTVRPVIAAEYALQDIVTAQRDFERKRGVGKIVLRVA